MVDARDTSFTRSWPTSPQSPPSFCPNCRRPTKNVASLSAADWPLPGTVGGEDRQRGAEQDARPHARPQRLRSAHSPPSRASSTAITAAFQPSGTRRARRRTSSCASLTTRATSAAGSPASSSVSAEAAAAGRPLPQVRQVAAGARDLAVGVADLDRLRGDGGAGRVRHLDRVGALVLGAEGEADRTRAVRAPSSARRPTLPRVRARGHYTPADPRSSRRRAGAAARAARARPRAAAAPGRAPGPARPGGRTGRGGGRAGARSGRTPAGRRPSRGASARGSARRRSRPCRCRSSASPSGCAARSGPASSPCRAHTTAPGFSGQHAAVAGERGQRVPGARPGGAVVPAGTRDGGAPRR